MMASVSRKVVRNCIYKVDEDEREVVFFCGFVYELAISIIMIIVTCLEDSIFWIDFFFFLLSFICIFVLVMITAHFLWEYVYSWSSPKKKYALGLSILIVTSHVHLEIYWNEKLYFMNQAF